MRLTPKQELVLAALKRGARLYRVEDGGAPSARRLSYPEYDDHYFLSEEGAKEFIGVDRRTVKKFREAGLIVAVKKDRWEINPLIIKKGGEAYEI